jgi:hypothetical protein
LHEPTENIVHDRVIPKAQILCGLSGLLGLGTFPSKLPVLRLPRVAVALSLEDGKQREQEFVAILLGSCCPALPLATHLHERCTTSMYFVSHNGIPWDLVSETEAVAQGKQSYPSQLEIALLLSKNLQV